jgi:hypothetical protein
LFSLLKLSVPVCFAFLPVTLLGADYHFMPAGAPQAGMAYVSVMKHDFWSAFHNQAALSFSRKPSFGSNYENRFGLPELSTCSAGLILPVPRATLGLIYSRFGYRDFRRDMAGIGCGLSLSHSVSAGIQIDCFTEKSYGDYASWYSVTFEGGLSVLLNEKTVLAFHFFNPVPGRFRQREMVSSLSTGIGIMPGKGLFAGVEADLSSSGEYDLRTGFEYELSEKVILRGGFRTEHSSFCFGLGYRLKPLSVDLAFSTHDRLGVTSSVSLVFNI